MKLSALRLEIPRAAPVPVRDGAIDLTYQGMQLRMIELGRADEDQTRE
jgi:hypothetical protein